MKTLYLQCNMGAAGDMLMAALYELLSEEEKVRFLDVMNHLGLPEVKVEAVSAVKCGITGTHMDVTVHGEDEEHLHEDHHHHEHEYHHEHDHEHAHHRDHHHEHHHSSLDNILHCISHLPVSGAVKANASAVYTRIAKAEAQVHGQPMEHIHFHEVGTWDAVADVVGVCLLLEMLGAEEILASPVHVGCGTVRCAHGILPVPAPATALLLKDVPIYGGAVQGELCTPTGAALLSQFVSRFGDMPPMKLQKTGYGMGKKEFPQANCVRAMLGETDASGDAIAELSCNLDDMTPEAIGYAMEQLLNAGALDVFTAPIGMKKCRPGVMLTCLCRLSDRQEMAGLLLRHTTTLGVRETVCTRYTLNRRTETVETPYGEIRVKHAAGYGITKAKPEYDDVARAAREHGVTIAEVLKTL